MTADPFNETAGFRPAVSNDHSSIRFTQVCPSASSRFSDCLKLSRIGQMTIWQIIGRLAPFVKPYRRWVIFSLILTHKHAAPPEQRQVSHVLLPKYPVRHFD